MMSFGRNMRSFDLPSTWRVGIRSSFPGKYKSPDECSILENIFQPTKRHRAWRRYFSTQLVRRRSGSTLELRRFAYRGALRVAPLLPIPELAAPSARRERSLPPIRTRASVRCEPDFGRMRISDAGGSCRVSQRVSPADLNALASSVGKRPGQRLQASLDRLGSAAKRRLTA